MKTVALSMLLTICSICTYSQDDEIQWINLSHEPFRFSDETEVETEDSYSEIGFVKAGLEIPNTIVNISDTLELNFYSENDLSLSKKIAFSEIEDFLISEDYYTFVIGSGNLLENSNSSYRVLSNGEYSSEIFIYESNE